MKKSLYLALVLGATALLLGVWLPKEKLEYTERQIPSAPRQAAENGGGVIERSVAATASDSNRAEAMQPRLAASPAQSPSIGDSIAVGIDGMTPESAMTTALALARCSTLPIQAQVTDTRIAREPAGVTRTRLLAERGELMALEQNCQTIPAEYQTVGGEYQLRSRLLRHAYASKIPGAASELMKIPEQFVGVSPSELKDRAIHDARSGDVQTMAALLLASGNHSLEDEDLKLYAFALQRAVRNPELRALVEPTQVLYSRVLEERWNRQFPNAQTSTVQGFNVDAQGVFLYPKGYTEPRDESYQARAQALDAALAKAARAMRKPS